MATDFEALAGEAEADERRRRKPTDFEALSQEAGQPRAEEQPSDIDFGEALKTRSLVGLAERAISRLAHGGETPEETAYYKRAAAYEPKTAMGRFALRAAGLGADLPAYLATGGPAGRIAAKIGGEALVSGGVAGVAARMLGRVGTSAATLGGVEGIRETLRQPATGEAVRPGRILSEAGKGAVVGAAAGTVGGLPGPLAVPAEATAMELAGAGLEGRRVSPGNVASNAVLFGLMRLGGHYQTVAERAVESVRVATASAQRLVQARNTLRDARASGQPEAIAAAEQETATAQAALNPSRERMMADVEAAQDAHRQAVSEGKIQMKAPGPPIEKPFVAPSGAPRPPETESIAGSIRRPIPAVVEQEAQPEPVRAVPPAEPTPTVEQTVPARAIPPSAPGARPAPGAAIEPRPAVQAIAEAARRPPVEKVMPSPSSTQPTEFGKGDLVEFGGRQWTVVDTSYREQGDLASGTSIRAKLLLVKESAGKGKPRWIPEALANAPSRKGLVPTAVPRGRLPDLPRSDPAAVARFIRDNGGLTDTANAGEVKKASQNYPRVISGKRVSGLSFDEWAERLHEERPDVWKSREDAFDWLRNEWAEGARAPERQAAPSRFAEVRVEEQARRMGLSGVPGEEVARTPGEPVTGGELETGEIVYLPGEKDAFRVEQRPEGAVLEDDVTVRLRSDQEVMAVRLGRPAAAGGVVAPTKGGQPALPGMESAVESAERHGVAASEAERRQNEAARTGQLSMLDEGVNREIQQAAEARRVEGEQAETQAPLFEERQTIEQEPPPRSVGAAGRKEMFELGREARRKAAEDYRNLTLEAQKAGLLKPGENFPRMSAAESKKLRQRIEVARAGGDEQEARALEIKLKLSRYAKVRAGLARTAITFPKEGLPLAPVERRILEADGPFDEGKARLLGRTNITDEEWADLGPKERVVHIVRSLFRAAHASHIDKILTTERFKVWEMPQEDLETVLVAVGRRMAEAGFEKAPPKLEAAIGKLERGEALPDHLTREQIIRTYWKWSPAWYVMQSIGVLEGPGGLFSIEQKYNRERMFWRQYLDQMFRDPNGKRIRGTADAKIVGELIDNPSRDPRMVERPMIGAARWHRVLARRWLELDLDFARRQGLPEERQIKSGHLAHVQDRQFAREPAAEQDIRTFHRLAKLHLGQDYDGNAIAGLLGEKLSRGKLLQLVEGFQGKRAPRTMKGAKRRIETILAGDDTAALPRSIRQPFLKRRTGAQGYEMDITKVADAYLPYVLRKIHLEPMVESFGPVIEALGIKQTPPGRVTQREYGRKLLEQIIGVPSKWDAAWNAWLESKQIQQGHGLFNVPIIRSIFQPNLPTRIADVTTRAQYARLLGLAVDSMVTNATQAPNTWKEAGLKHAAMGYGKALNPANWKEIYHEALGGMFEPFISGEKALRLNIFEKAMMSPFTFQEMINRGAAYYAGISKAKAQGLSDEVSIRAGLAATSDYIRNVAPEAYDPLFFTTPARAAAQETMIRSQFGSRWAGTSPWLKGPGARVSFQFYGYPTQQAALLYDGVIHDLGRGEYGRFARSLLLTAWTVAVGKWVGEKVGLDFSNLWSIPGIMPRGFGPTAQDMIDIGTVALIPGMTGESALVRLRRSHPYVANRVEQLIRNLTGQREGKEALPGERAQARAEAAGPLSEIRAVSKYQRVRKNEQPTPYAFLPIKPIEEPKPAPSRRESRRRGRRRAS